MKILLAFFDMIRVDHIQMYNPQAEKTVFDTMFQKIGGTLFSKCYTPAPDTPRSLACLWSGYIPSNNGCDTRIKWPHFFMKEGISTIFDNAKERDYDINICLNKHSIDTGEFKYQNSEKTFLCYDVDSFLEKGNFSENSISFIGNEDSHVVVGEFGGSDYALREANRLIECYFEKYLTIDFLNQFDVVVFFSDHGLKTTKEKYTQKSKLDLLLDGRTKLLMFYHTKGDKGVKKDDRLCSMVDLYSTIEQLTGGTDMRDGFSMLQPPQRKIMHIEDHTDFSVSPEVMVKQWRVISDKLDIRTDLNETIDENGNPADLNLILPYLKEVSPKIVDLQKQYEIWEFYKKLCMPAPKYFVGEKRPSHLKTMFFKVSWQTFITNSNIDSMSTTSRIATNTIFLYLNVAVKALVSLYVTRLVLDALGASDYGIYNVVGGLISMLCFLNTSMASVTQRFMNYNQGIGDLLRLKSIFNISIVFHLAIALIVVVMMVALKPVFFEHMLNIDANKVYAASCLYYFAMVSTAFTIMTVPYDAVLNSHENMRYYFYVGMVQSALNLLAAIYICNYHGERLIVYGFFMSAIAIITMIIMRVYCKRHYEECVFSPRKYYRKELFTDVFKYSGWEFVGHSSETFFGWASNIVINKFFGTVVNAAAGISNQLSGQLQVLSSNLLKAVNPVMVKYESSGNRDKMFQMTISSCKLSLFCLFLVSIPFYAECDYILKIWLKSVPKGTLLFCQLMVVLRLIEQATLPLKTAIDAIGKVKWLNIFILIIGILQICMIYGFFSVGLPPYMWIVAMTIIAVVYSVYKVVYCACFAGMDWKQYVKEVVFRSVISYALPIVVSIAITTFFPSSFFRLIAVLVVSTLFCCAMFYLCGLNAMEKAEVNKLLCNIKNRIR